ncbi:MAG: hypothetical protein PVJ21_07760 [Anaerolineales bacterium]|jgi:hypothetical protein
MNHLYFCNFKTLIFWGVFDLALNAFPVMRVEISNDYSIGRIVFVDKIGQNNFKSDIIPAMRNKVELNSAAALATSAARVMGCMFNL